MRLGSLCRHLKIAGRVIISRFFHVTNEASLKLATHPAKRITDEIRILLWLLCGEASSVRALDIGIDPVEDGLNDLPLVGAGAAGGSHE